MRIVAEGPLDILESGNHTLYVLQGYVMVGDGPISTLVRQFVLYRGQCDEIRWLNSSATITSGLSVARIIMLAMQVPTFGDAVVCSIGELELDVPHVNLQRLQNEAAQLIQFFADKKVKKLVFLLPLEKPNENKPI